MLLKPSVMQFLALLMLALLPVFFVPLADLNLAINTGTLSAFSVLLLRSVQYAAFATAAFVPVLCMLRATPQPLASRPTILPFVVGAVSALAAVSLGVSPVLVLAVGIAIHAAVQTIHVPANNRERSAT